MDQCFQMYNTKKKPKLILKNLYLIKEYKQKFEFTLFNNANYNI
jgi:hypothetical protein